MPDDAEKYTLAFGAGGMVAARIDCNRGRGTWRSPAPKQLELGPLALTRAMCRPGSLHDQIVKQWANIRSYVFEDGRLSLSLMAHGGVYEFQPAQGEKTALRSAFARRAPAAGRAAARVRAARP